jgi:ribosome-binding factor A
VTRRTDRVAEEIREEVARIIPALKDPRLGFVTVTRVNVSPDLQHARVYVGILGSEADRTQGLQSLKRAAGFVRREVGHRIRLRHVPEIQFLYDQGLDASDRIAQLLEEARPPRDDDPQEGSGE